MDTGIDLFQQLVVAPLQVALNHLSAFLSSVLGAVVILIIGVTISKLLEQIVVRGLKLIMLDKIAEEIQLSTVLVRGGIRRKLSELIGVIIYWIVLLAFVMTALNALGLTVAAELFQQIVGFLPNVVASVFILIIGIFAAAFLATTVRTAAAAAGITQANFLGQAVQAVVITFALVASLKQLQIQFVGEVFLIILAGISLGAAIAFGFGCKELASEWVHGIIQELQPRKK